MNVKKYLELFKKFINISYLKELKKIVNINNNILNRKYVFLGY